MRKLLCLFTCLPVLLSVGHAAGIVTLFDTITGGPLSGVGIIQQSGVYGEYYSSFSTGNQAFILQNVTLTLGPLLSPGTATLNVDLFADNSIVPGTNLGTIGTISDSSITQLDNYSFTANILLDANSRYWIGISPSGGDTTSQWEWTTGIFTPDVSSEYYYESADGAFLNGAYPQMMQVTGTNATSSVPEPSTILFAALGLCAVALLRRRSTAKPRP